MLLNASRNYFDFKLDDLHNDFDNALDYIVEQSGVNVYDIRIDGDYEEFLQPYFRDRDISAAIYGFNPDVVYDSQADDVYNALYTDFMATETDRVSYLLYKGLPILVYNGQDDLIVTTPGTMKWIDRVYFSQAEEFRNKLFSPWTLNGKMVGTIKSAGLLEFRVVFNAGHMVPMDRPQEALDMAVSFVSRVVSNDV